VGGGLSLFAFFASAGPALRFSITEPLNHPSSRNPTVISRGIAIILDPMASTLYLDVSGLRSASATVPSDEGAASPRPRRVIQTSWQSEVLRAYWGLQRGGGTLRTFRSIAVCSLSLVLPLLGVAPIASPAWASVSTAASSSRTRVEADFNGDEFADLAIGVPDENLVVSGNAGAVNVLDVGAVNVLYGTSTGLTAFGDQFWHQGVPGVAGDGPEAGDQFGSSLTAGYFNGDQFADLAIGVPTEDVGATSDAGAVNILYGSLDGLTAAGSQSWTQGGLGLPEADTDTEAGDRFGYSLAAANYGRTSQDDLAVGVPFEDVGTTFSVGAVNLIYGSAAGLDPAEGQTGQFWHQGVTGVAGDGAEEFDSFGRALAAANLGKSSQADLAVGVPGEEVGTPSDAGAVNVLYGGSTGLTTSGDQFWHQGRTGVAGDGPQLNDSFGEALAAANLGKSSQADLAVGVPEEGVGTTQNAGA
jgi:hypothetical protein